MLFNTFVFIFGFLPLAMAATYLLGRWRQDAAKAALVLASVVFYAWGSPHDLPLLAGSLVVTYAVSVQIRRATTSNKPRAASAWLWLGLLANLAFLGWFKYANFIATNIGDPFHTPVRLPLAISFFTFVNIAFLVDQSRGRGGPVGALDFAVLTTFFPKLLSGPIVHSQEFSPQTRTRRFGRIIWRNVLVGLVIFSIGLFKKTVIADTLADYVNPLFEAGRGAKGFGLITGWTAALGYTFQLYFDFSGYSDMAIGAARMFGVKLPINFHSPLRAASVVDYWRRWHMTLQRLIVSLVFEPLSLPLNRFAAARGLSGWSNFLTTISLPIFATFLAVGIWHGAGWTFVVFGAMHGLYVSVNEAWRDRERQLRRRLRRAGRTAREPGWARITCYHALTLAAIVYANVMFRSPNLGAALPLWGGMSGLHGVTISGPGVSLGLAAVLLLSAGIVFLAPNTQQIMGRFDPAFNWSEFRTVSPAPLKWTWRFSAVGLAFAGLTLFLGLMFIQRGQAVFLYFKF